MAKAARLRNRILLAVIAGIFIWLNRDGAGPDTLGLDESERTLTPAENPSEASPPAGGGGKSGVPRSDGSITGMIASDTLRTCR